MAKPKQAARGLAKPAHTKPATDPVRPPALPSPVALPLQHYFSRAPFQLVTIGAVALYSIRLSSTPNLPISLANFVHTLAVEPVSTLWVLLAGVAAIQAYFAIWVRGVRREALGLVKRTSEPARAKRGFTATMKDLTSEAMSGKAPRRPPAVQATLDNFDFVAPAALILLASTFAFHCSAVLLGAPLFSKFTETLLLSALLALLSIGPVAVAVPHTEKYVWIRLFSSLSPANDLEIALLAPALGAILGCWAGALPIPLDWDRPWQAWPTTCVLGTLGGHAVGTVVGLGICSWNAAKRSEAEHLKSA